MLAEHARVELGRHFVVLFVGRGGLDRDRTPRQSADEIGEALALGFRIAGVLFAQPRGEERADAVTDDEVGNQIALEQTHGERGHRISWGVGVANRARIGRSDRYSA